MNDLRHADVLGEAGVVALVLRRADGTTQTLTPSAPVKAVAGWQQVSGVVDVSGLDVVGSSFQLGFVNETAPSPLLVDNLWFAPLGAALRNS